jgi:membrane protein involved in colicin uptake
LTSSYQSRLQREAARVAAEKAAVEAKAAAEAKAKADAELAAARSFNGLQAPPSSAGNGNSTGGPIAYGVVNAAKNEFALAGLFLAIASLF